MSIKHLGPGSKNPPLIKGGKLRLYSMAYCPYSHRIRLILAAKNVDYELINVNTTKKPEWFTEINSTGQVPCIQLDDGRVLSDSLIVADYLDSVYPNKLSPIDPFKCGQHKFISDSFTKATSDFWKLYKGFDQAAYDSIKKGLDQIEKKLDGKFFGGANPAMVDYMLWPWFERFEFVKTKHNVEPFKEAKFPKLSAWVKAMKELSAVKQTMLSIEKYNAFIDSYVKNENDPNYDV